MKKALTEAHAAGVKDGEAKCEKSETDLRLSDAALTRTVKQLQEAEAKLAALTAEAGRIRVQAFNEMAEYCRREQRAICGGSPECIVGDAYKTGRHDGMGELAKLTAENQRMREALMKIMTWWPTVSYARMKLLIDPVQVCREALSPSEKPAPEVKPVSQGYTACKAKDPTPRTPWLHAMGGHVCAKDKGHSGYHACCGGHCSHVWYSKKTAQDAGAGKGEGA